MNRGSSPFAVAAAPPGPPPGYVARVTGGVLLPVFTLLSAVWFATMVVGLLSAWWTTQHVHFGFWPQDTWFNLPDVPRWVAIAVILVVYALIALPIGAARKAALYYANGGRLHGWADAWSGLLWLAVVAVLLLAAWQFMPHLHEMLRHAHHGTSAVIHL